MPAWRVGKLRGSSQGESLPGPPPLRQRLPASVQHHLQPRDHAAMSCLVHDRRLHALLRLLSRQLAAVDCGHDLRRKLAKLGPVLQPGAQQEAA